MPARSTTITTRPTKNRPPRPKSTPLPTPHKTEVVAGRLVGVFGLHGELKADPSRSGIDTIAADLDVTLLAPDGARTERTIAALRRHQGRLLLSFAGIADPDAAAALVGSAIVIPRALVPMAEGEYFDDDLVGCELLGLDGSALGAVVEVLHHPAHDVLAVGAKRDLVPLVHAFIREVDVVGRRIVVDLPEGLLTGTPDQA